MARVFPHADSVRSSSPNSFRAVYHFGYFRDWLAADFNKFIMIDSYATFIDGNPLSEYFTCDLFYDDADSPR